VTLRARPRGDGAADTAAYPVVSVGGESLSPVALAAVPAGGVLRMWLVAYHLGSSEGDLRLGAQLLAADGKPLGDGALSVLSRSAAGPDGRRNVLLAFQAPSGLASGRYGLRVFAEDGATGEKRQAVAAFRVP
jgi:hypothetical protein